jgi:TonB-linked SusC/RagA family outer membrane protein
LSLSGGNDKTTFYLSGEYFNQDGIAAGSKFDRYSLRLNIDNQARSWLKLGANFNFSQTDESLATTQENLILNALTLSPNIPVKNPDGSWGGADATNGSSVQFSPLNPVAIGNLVTNDYKRRQMLGGLTADVTLMKGLVFRTTLNGNIGSKSSHYFIPTWKLGDKRNDVANLTDGSGNSTYWNWNQLLQYNIKIEKHDIGVMVSHEAQESLWEDISGGRNSFSTNDIPVLPIGDAKSATNDGHKWQWAMESFFGRVNYTFNDRYIVQGALRADGSSNFGPTNRWGVFPSASAAWRVSQESFFQNIEVIDELKLRVEAGLTGNQGSSGIYGPLEAVSTPWGTGFTLNKYPNADLKWEETKTFNVGFNINLLNNRIQLEGDFYVKKTDNLLMSNPLPDYMGTSGEGNIDPPTVNIGSLENKGWGITINTINMDRAGFKWSSNLNFSGFNAKITKFYSETAFVDRTSWYMNNWTQRSAVGRAPWLFYGYVADGIFQSLEEINNSALPVDNSGNELAASPSSVWVGDIKYKDLNTDGVINEKDQTYIGNPWPTITFGFTNNFSYKGFDLSVLLTGSYGNDVYNYLGFVNTNPNNIYLGQNLLRETFGYARVEGASTEAHLTNPGTTIPRISGSDVNGNGKRFTQNFVEDGSYIRIKNISLSYSLPGTLIGKQDVVKKVRATVGVQNLATFTKYKGYDPEVGAFVGKEVNPDRQSIGVDYGRYPLTPTYMFSLSVDF